MEKQKQTAQPKETPEQRPPVFIGLKTGNLYINPNGATITYVKLATPKCPDTGLQYNIGPCTSPCGVWAGNGRIYTGPIDDETMANIMIYG